MTISATDLELPDAVDVQISEDTLSVELDDGRTISVPLELVPRVDPCNTRRASWRMIGRGHGVHWEDLDEDICVEGLLAGRPSGESQSSLKQWLESR